MYQYNPLLKSKQVVKESGEPIALLTVAYLVIGRIAASIGDQRKIKALTKIVEAYPNPNTLYAKLKQNPKTIKLANSLSQMVDLETWQGDENDYYCYSTWILKYVVHYLSILRWLATILGGPISLAYQIMKTAATKDYDADRIIFGKNSNSNNNQNNLKDTPTTKPNIKTSQIPQKKQKSLSDEDALILAISYITMYHDKDPILIKEYKEFEKQGMSIYGNYTNIIMCCYTCIDHMNRGVSSKVIATQTKSGKRLVSWIRYQLKHNKMLISFMNSKK